MDTNVHPVSQRPKNIKRIVHWNGWLETTTKPMLFFVFGMVPQIIQTLVFGLSWEICTHM